MLFVPELISPNGIESVQDFLTHAPTDKYLEIFTLASSKNNVESLSSNNTNWSLYVLDYSGKCELPLPEFVN